jgi:phosphoadenosine phosphosulfate reductase
MSNNDGKIEFMKLYSENPSKFEAETAKDILSLSIKTFSPKIAFASSFGAEDVVIIDLM